MPVIKDGQTLDNIWVALDGAAPDSLAPETPVLVSLAEWQAGREALAGRFDRLALRLDPADAVESVAGDVHLFEVVVLRFPKFNDGRGFSQARLLRDRYAFEGEIRAAGHVIRDQFLHLQRCGVDAVEVADASLAAAWDNARARFPGHYQPAFDRRPMHRPTTTSAAASLAPAFAAIEPAVMASWAY